MFKIGDAVVCTKPYDNLDEIVGTVGVIVNKHPYVDEWGVRWEKYVDLMHNLDGDCEAGHGWFIKDTHIEHLNITLENE